MPPKGKKKKTAAPKSEAELLRLEEQKRRAAEAKAAQRYQAVVHEEEIGRLNALKVRAKWQEMMRATLNETLRDALLSQQRAHERLADRRAHRLAVLARDLAEAEAQHAVAHNSQLRSIDELMVLHRNHIDGLESAFSTRVRDLAADFSLERARLTKQHLVARNDVLGVVYRLDQNHVETEADATHDFQSTCDDLRNRHLEEKHALRIQLEGTIEELWKQFQAALAAYCAATDDRKRQFEDLKRRDLDAASTIEAQVRKLSRLSEAVASTKARLGMLAKDSEVRLADLKAAKERVVREFQTLKRQMNTQRECERKKLIELTRLRITSSRTLLEYAEIAEKILLLAELNNKLCTQEEVNMWAAGTATRAESASTTRGVDHDKKKDEVLEAAADQQKQIFNRILLDTAILEDKCDRLREERKTLQKILRDYLHGTKIKSMRQEKATKLAMIKGNAKLILQVPTHQVYKKQDPVKSHLKNSSGFPTIANNANFGDQRHPGLQM